MAFVKIGLLVASLAAATGCNDASLSGGAKKAATEDDESKAKGDEDSPLGTPSGDPDGPGGNGPGQNGNAGENDDGSQTGDVDSASDLIKLCQDAPLKTSVKLLTPTIKNGAPGNKVSYELQLLDCKGNPRPLSAQFIRFDVDAEVDDTFPLSYVVTVGSQTVSGILEVVEGVDLFGKTGEEYFHHKTDQAVTLTSAALTAILTIDLKGQRHDPIGAGSGGSFSCASYLRFGDAEPVAQTVTFVE